FNDGSSGETYVIGGDNEWKNIDLVKEICSLLNEEAPDETVGDYHKLITFVADRPGHNFRYAIDASKIKRELGWQPAGAFRERLRETVRWYIRRYNS